MSNISTMASVLGSIPFDLKSHPFLLCTGVLLPYLLLVRHLRYRRLNNLLKAIERDCGTVRKSSDIPLYHAEAIVRNVGTWDFPKMMRLSLQFALFRTYGIPTISSLLWKTRQLAQRSTAHRRYVDTSVLIIETLSFPLESPRGQLAVERINYLHSRHKGSISNDDLLYTLALFMCQPGVFIDRFEWRKLHPVEKMGLHRFWSQMGVMMGIQGIPDSYEAIYEWANAYETKYMVPAEVNAKVAVATVDILLYFVPGFLHSSALPIIHAICDPRLRASFYWPDPPSYATTLVNALFGFRAFVIRNLFLPRFSPHHGITHDPVDASVPLSQRRYYTSIWETDPWYFKKTYWNTYGPGALLCKFMGWAVPNQEFDSVSGYRIGEMGPKAAIGKGPGNDGCEPGSFLGSGTIISNTTEEFHKKAVEGAGTCPMFVD
ncbi:hypothetical protein TWF696_001629 [Orbilia brochopaga]|uniref:ER-bound oxygenase mpaB/mpaB'/Rubber oxygenase catalytic domain-containing protein n=1 Tax=Orbilia brochopaga TaxID=3140254 RepID=A0AAV9UA07_9PEZI